MGILVKGAPGSVKADFRGFFGSGRGRERKCVRFGAVSK